MTDQLPTEAEGEDSVSDPQELTYEEAVPLIEFDDVITFELRARRRDGGFDDVEVAADDYEDADWNLQLLARQTAESLAIRAVASNETEDIVFTVDMAAIYRKQESFVINKHELNRFIDFVALPNLYPYIRQAVHDLSSRLGYPLTLSLLRVGATRSQLIGEAAE